MPRPASQPPEPPAERRWRRPWRDPLVPAAGGLVVAHLIVVQASVGLRPEHLAGDLALWALVLAGLRWPGVRATALVLLPVWLVGFAYEAVKLLLPLRGTIHVADLYTLDARLFGTVGADGRLETLSHALQAHTSPALDVLTGAAYIAYFLLPLAFMLIWTWRGQRARALRLAWAFLLLNVLGFAIQLAWPAAPPWYVDAYGLGPAVLSAAPSAAGAARFDAALGVSYFADFYTRNVNVFGAMPSLHVAYPTVAALAAAGLGVRWFAPAAALSLLVGFSALYLNHHYVLDVLAGVALAVLSYAAVAFGARALARGARSRDATPALRGGDHV